MTQVNRRSRGRSVLGKASRIERAFCKARRGGQVVGERRRGEERGECGGAQQGDDPSARHRGLHGNLRLSDL